jgi:hypothetical protein
LRHNSTATTQCQQPPLIRRDSFSMKKINVFMLTYL